MVSDFFTFARKRHQIYIDRQAGEPSPWTDDPILQQYSFTNVFRELDKTTVWFRENVRDAYTYDPAVFMATVVFRLFNRMSTGAAIFTNNAGITPFEQFMDSGIAEDMRDGILAKRGKGPYCTGSYIINSPNGMDKLTGVLQMIQWVYDGQKAVWEAIKRGALEGVWEELRKFPHIADFTSYEIVTDLRHTHLLNEAPDIMTWANPGPGAMRGLNRMHGRPLNSKQKKHLFIEEMRDLLVESLNTDSWPCEWPDMEMRDIEHTLCEWDKYERTRLGEGRPRQKFKST